VTSPVREIKLITRTAIIAGINASFILD